MGWGQIIVISDHESVIVGEVANAGRVAKVFLAEGIGFRLALLYFYSF